MARNAGQKSRQKSSQKSTAAPRIRRSVLARPTARGLAFIGFAIVLGIVSYAAGRVELLYGAALLFLLPIAGIVVVRLRPLRLSVTRVFSPPVVTAGRTTTISLDIRNTSSSPSAPAVWTDRIPWEPGTAGPGMVPVLPPGGVARAKDIPRDLQANTRLAYTLRPPVRGVYDIGPLAVEYTDPFGLCVSRVTVGVRQSLYVVPAISPLAENGPIFIAGDGTARLTQRAATGSDDDLMTREYRSGDALRRVHWRASARYGELMVRQEEQRSVPEARLLIDTRRDGYGDTLSDFGVEDDGYRWFEWAIRMLASAGVRLHQSGFLVQVMETGARQIAPLGDASQGSGQDVEFLLSLAGLRLSEPSAGGLGAPSEERNRSAVGPIIAIVASPSAESLAWIIAQRRPYESGLAFVIDTGSPAVAHAMEDAGWNCILVADTDDPAAVWSRNASFTPPIVGRA